MVSKCPVIQRKSLIVYLGYRAKQSKAKKIIRKIFCALDKQASQWEMYFECLKMPPIIVFGAKFIDCNIHHKQSTEHILMPEIRGVQSAEMSNSMGSFILIVFYLNANVLTQCSIILSSENLYREVIMKTINKEGGRLVMKCPGFACQGMNGTGVTLLLLPQ